jgi:hypothetical protein
MEQFVKTGFCKHAGDRLFDHSMTLGSGCPQQKSRVKLFAETCKKRRKKKRNAGTLCRREAATKFPTGKMNTGEVSKQKLQPEFLSLFRTPCCK